MSNVTALSDEHVGIIREWVAGGGKLIATFQTSLFDVSGVQREEFGLADVFGVNYGGAIIKTEIDCYQKILTRNPMMKGFENTELLHNSGKTLLVNTAPGATEITGYLPRINNQPPENAFPENWDSPNPIMVSNTFGKGQVVYFANEAARLIYTIGHPDYRHLLENSIDILLGNHAILKTNAPASVHVYLNQSDKDPMVYQLSLVNTSSSTHRPLRELVPVSGIEVVLPFDIAAHESLFGMNIFIRVDRNTLQIDNLEEFCSIKLVKN